MDLNIENINSIMNKMNEQTDYILSITENVVKKYSEPLDLLMKNIYNDIIIKKDTPASKQIIEQYYLELTNVLYFMYEKVEQLGVFDDISKASAKESYNNAYMNGSSVFENKKPTVAELTAVAEKNSLYDTTVNNMYSRSYKIFKSKIDAGYEMCKCLNKILSSRLQEEVMSEKNVDNGTQLLLENKI